MIRMTDVGVGRLLAEGAKEGIISSDEVTTVLDILSDLAMGFSATADNTEFINAEKHARTRQKQAQALYDGLETAIDFYAKRE